MIRTRDSFPARTFGRAWSETEIDDDGELVLDVQPVHCPGCQHPLDLGSLDDIEVHRCAYCRKRTRFLWSDRRGMAVAESRGPNADWDEESWDDLWRDFDQDDDGEDGEEPECVNGCEDPVFGGPAGEVCERGRWVCAVCGADGSEDGF
jgi:Transcription factor zinc-finger